MCVEAMFLHLRLDSRVGVFLVSKLALCSGRLQPFSGYLFSWANHSLAMYQNAGEAGRIITSLPQFGGIILLRRLFIGRFL